MEVDFKKFKISFKLFFIGLICILISLFYFDGRFKFLPDWLALLAIFNVVGNVLILIALFRTYKINRHFYLSLLTFGFFVAVGILKSVCLTSTDDFYINWAKGLDWSIQVLKCIIYIYFFLGCHDYFVSIKFARTDKYAKVGAFILIGLLILERLSVFLLFFNPVRANVWLNRICTFGQIIIRINMYSFLVVACIVLITSMNKRRKELMNNEENK